MHIPDEILEEVRSRNDIVDVISSRVQLKRSGSTLFGLCPFHNEKTPSFSVTPSKQMFYCFGCHKGGNVITFVQEYENLSFQDAVRLLADRAGISLPEVQESEEGRQAQSLKARLLEVNKAAGTFYYCQLRSPEGKSGLAYLQGRQLSEETMKRFGIGYAGKYSNSLYRFLKAKGYDDDLLRQTGLFSADEKNGMYDKFWNRVMFPIMDAQSRVIGFGGRVLGDAKPKYLNSPENELFNKRRNLYGLHIARRSRKDSLILCEGYMDVIAMHQAGFDNAVASLGTALTEEQVSLLARYTKQIIIAYDSDEAGKDAAMRAVPMLQEGGLSVKVLSMKPYKDPDELIKALGDEGMRKRIDEAVNGFLFEASVLYDRFDQQDPDGRTQFWQELASLIAGCEMEARRENYIQAAAQAYAIRPEVLRDMVSNILLSGIPRSRVRKSYDPSKKAAGDEGLLLSQRLLLTWLTQYPRFYDVLKQFLAPDDFTNPTYRETARLLYDQLEEGRLNEAAIIDHFQDSDEQTGIAELFHAQIKTQSGAELVKAMKETILKVSDAAISGLSKDGVRLDSLQQMLERKRRAEKINAVQIDLGREEE